jgi:hypothetical protein
MIPEEREAEPPGGILKDPDVLGHNLLANPIAWNDGYAICFMATSGQSNRSLAMGWGSFDRILWTTRSGSASDLGSDWEEMRYGRG